LVTPSARVKRQTPACPKCVSDTRNTAGIVASFLYLLYNNNL
jgi:hypothetical protein